MFHSNAFVDIFIPTTHLIKNMTCQRYIAGGEIFSDRKSFCLKDLEDIYHSKLCSAGKIII